MNNQNQKIKLIVPLLAGLLLPVAALAQTTTAAAPLPPAEPSYTQIAGTHEVTLGGGGASNKDLDSSFGSIDLGFGTYLSPLSEIVIRQSLAYSNPDDGAKGWSGSTRLAYDFNFSSTSTFRPFLGASAGRIYGNTVHDTWAAGLEGGAKVFVKAQTFVFAMVSYDWLFDHGDEIDDQFNDGRFGWTLGVGFQF